MNIVVQKYGGTSVGSVERINEVANRILQYQQKQQAMVVVVVSAMAGETNRLIRLCDSISNNLPSAQRDAVISTGEQVSAGLLAMALCHRRIKAQSISGHQIGIHTDNSHGKARIIAIDNTAIQNLLDEGITPIIPGFQGQSTNHQVTTLGRGGSDTTAVALAAALSAKECQIYTDVDGVYTTDPRICKQARLLSSINFEEMLEMASLGSKVLQTRSVELAGKYKVPLRVLSSMTDNNGYVGGTLITYDKQHSMEQAVVSGITANKAEAKITITGIADKPGIAYQLLDAIAQEKINIDIIIQNVSTNGYTNFSFTVPLPELDIALETTKKVAKEIGAETVSGDDSIGKLSVVGIGMKSHAGVASKMFKVLADNDINIHMISTSEIKISVVIDQKKLDTAVCALHTAFDLDKER